MSTAPALSTLDRVGSSHEVSGVRFEEQVPIGYRGRLTEEVTSPIRELKHLAEDVGQLTEEVTSPAPTPSTHDPTTTTTDNDNNNTTTYSMSMLYVMMNAETSQAWERVGSMSAESQIIAVPARVGRVGR